MQQVAGDGGPGLGVIPGVKVEDSRRSWLSRARKEAEPGEGGRLVSMARWRSPGAEDGSSA